MWTLVNLGCVGSLARRVTSTTPVLYVGTVPPSVSQTYGPFCMSWLLLPIRSLSRVVSNTLRAKGPRCLHVPEGGLAHAPRSHGLRLDTHAL
eukprot:4601748-Prymnesium_polylepis.1